VEGLKRDLLTLQDYSGQDVLNLVDLTLKVKNLGKKKISLLEGKTAALLFEKPSTRTRVSFEVAMKSLGGDSLYLEKKHLQLARGETISDTIKVLSRYIDVVVARVYSHEDLIEMSRNATIPVINALSDKFHPTQILADLATIKEKFGKLKGIKVAYVGDGNNVCNSLLIGCSKVGVNISVASPEKYLPAKEVIEWALKNAQKSGSQIEIVSDPFKAVKGADVVYTDTFVSIGMEKEREERLKTFLPKYQVNAKLIEATNRKSFFMHCLPAHRGEEVTDEVIDGSWSIVWDQAENKLHSAKAVLLNAFFGDEIPSLNLK